jgi:alkylation response protein AidB-like acyl-CoA dehydrogenase
MEFHETDEHRALREAVRTMTAKFGSQYYVNQVETGQTCDELWKAFGDAGYLGVNLPEEYGGGGAGLVELAIVIEESAAGGCPLLLLLVAVAISGEVIAEFGSPAQREEWLPRIAGGSTKVVFAITEPNAGSNTHKLSTTARRDGDDWVLNGTKYYISGVDNADAILVVTATGRDEQTGRAELTRPPWSAMWARASSRSSTG